MAMPPLKLIDTASNERTQLQPFDKLHLSGECLYVRRGANNRVLWFEAEPGICQDHWSITDLLPRDLDQIASLLACALGCELEPLKIDMPEGHDIRVWQLCPLRT